MYSRRREVREGLRPRPAESAVAPQAPTAGTVQASRISAGKEKVITRFTRRAEDGHDDVRSVTAARSRGGRSAVVDVTTEGWARHGHSRYRRSDGVHAAPRGDAGPRNAPPRLHPEGVRGDEHAGKPTPVDVKILGADRLRQRGIDVASARSRSKKDTGDAQHVRLFNMESAADDSVSNRAGEDHTEAGLFDAFVVDVKPSDGGSGNLKYWITSTARGSSGRLRDP